MAISDGHTHKARLLLIELLLSQLKNRRVLKIQEISFPLSTKTSLFYLEMAEKNKVKDTYPH